MDLLLGITCLHSNISCCFNFRTKSKLKQLNFSDLFNIVNIQSIIKSVESKFFKYLNKDVWQDEHLR